MNRIKLSSQHSELRTHSVNVRFNLAELQEVDMLRKHRSRSSFIRDTFFQQSPKPIPEINITSYVALSKLANDIHTLSKTHNYLDNSLIVNLTSSLHQLRMILIAGKDKP
jgi:hypothetical protein